MAKKTTASKTKPKRKAKPKAKLNPKTSASPPRRKRPVPLPVSTGYWLLKSEPDAFSWDNLVAKGATGEPWSGVRNYTARNYMKAMRLGDRCFFYHSNEGLAVVGIAEVMALAHPDPSDDTGKWECVDLKAVAPMPRPVTLAEVKTNEKLAKMSLVTSFRLSVQPVQPDEWDEVLHMGGLDPKKLKAK
jgi:predicted RNA-binding protein with PUA-like domain